MRVESGRGWRIVLGDVLDLTATEIPLTVDAVAADPPYSSGGFTRGDRTADPVGKYRTSTAVSEGPPSFTGDNRDQRSYLAWSALWMRHVSRFLRRGAPFGAWSDWRQHPVTTDALQAAGYVWRGVFVWTKDNASRPQLGRFRNDAEFFVWGSLGPMPARVDVGVLPGCISCPPVHTTNRLALTEKPVPVMEAVVQCAPVGGVVLDPFAGAGSTGVACLRTGRSFIGCELDPTYFEIALERLRAEERGLSIADARSGQRSIFDAIGGGS